MELLSSSRNSSSATQPGLFKEMQTLLKVKDQSLTDDELIAESSTMFFAGTNRPTFICGLRKLTMKQARIQLQPQSLSRYGT